MMRRDTSGDVLARAGWLSAIFWVLGMGSRFAFLIWANNGGAATIGHFSATHSITSGEAWTVALLAMAVFEVCGRTLVQAVRREQLIGPPPRSRLEQDPASAGCSAARAGSANSGSRFAVSRAALAR